MLKDQDSQLILHSVCQHLHDKRAASGLCHVDLCAGTDCWPVTPSLRLPIRSIFQTSARSASRLASDDIRRLVLPGTCPPIHGYFKTTLLCALTILTRIQIWAKRRAVQNASRDKNLHQTSLLTRWFNGSYRLRLTTVWVHASHSWVVYLWLAQFWMCLIISLRSSSLSWPVYL